MKSPRPDLWGGAGCVVCPKSDRTSGAARPRFQVCSRTRAGKRMPGESLATVWLDSGVFWDSGRIKRTLKVECHPLLGGALKRTAASEKESEDCARRDVASLPHVPGSLLHTRCMVRGQ